MNRSLVFFDIDGTLITDDESRTFPESAKRAIKKLRENGHLAFINTGRVELNVEPFIREAGFDGYVFGCGTHIVSENQCLLHHTLSHELCAKIGLLTRECKMFPLFEAADRNTIDDRGEMPAEAKALLAYFTSNGRTLYTDIFADDFYFDKFAAWFDDSADIEKFKAGIEGTFDYIDRGKYMCEIVPTGFSKASGIQFLMDYYHVDMDHVYAFGDSNNDLPMLTFVKNSIGMEKSSEDVLKTVSFVTRKVEDDGIEYALKHFGLIDECKH